MNLRNMRRELDKLAMGGKIKEDHVDGLLINAIGRSVIESYTRGLLGDEVFEQASEDVSNLRYGENDTNAASVETAILAYESHEPSVRNSIKAPRFMESIMVASDLPAIVGRARELFIRDEEKYATSSFLTRSMTRRSVGNFHTINALKFDDDDKLYLTPEGENVKYDNFKASDDVYEIDKWTRAFGFTYEALVNDDIDSIRAHARKLGAIAQKNRVRALWDLFFTTINRQAPAGGAGLPTVANILWAETQMTTASPAAYPTVLVVPPVARATAYQSLNSQEDPLLPGTANAAYGLAELVVDRSLQDASQRTAGADIRDWLVVDDSQPFMEFAALKGLEAGGIIRWKQPDVETWEDFLSFENLTSAFQVVDAFGAKITEPTQLLRIQGA